MLGTMVLQERRVDKNLLGLFQVCQCPTLVFFVFLRPVYLRSCIKMINTNRRGQKPHRPHMGWHVQQRAATTESATPAHEAKS